MLLPQRSAPVFAMARPAKITAPVKTNVAALSKPEVFDHWQAGVRAAGDIGKNTITIYDVIGEDFWSGGGVTVNRIDAALRSIGNQDIELHVNSPGGDMFEGIAIYNRLREHPGKITAKVMGLAASAASVLVMAADEILIGPASFIMIHDCWVVAMGNRHDMADTAAFLAPFDAAMADVYAARTGKSTKDVAAMMDAETWLSGSQAIEQKFADGLLSADDMKEDETVSEQARAFNALRQTEIAMCKGGASRTEARGLIAKIKGTPGAVLEATTPGAGGASWAGAAADLINSFRS